MPIFFKRQCNRCGKEYKGYGRFFCSKTCGRKPITGYKECEWCKGKFPYRDSLLSRSSGGVGSINQRFCSLKCSMLWKNKIYLPAKMTDEHRKKLSDGARERFKGKKISAETIRKRILSISGPLHWNWKGGISPKNNAERSCVELKDWRRAVFKRDKYKCVLCGIGGRLEADHIKGWSEYPELRFDINNGRTLCKNCHSKTPNYRGRANKKVALNAL